MKIDIKSSLNKLDYDTNNRFDLLNRYNVANLSQQQKQGLAKTISNGASAKDISAFMDKEYKK